MIFNNKRVLIACLANPSSNPRPNRIINLLNQIKIKVDVLSFKTNKDLPIENEYLIKILRTPYYRNKRDLLKFLLTVSPFYNLKLKITELLGELYLIDHNIDFDNYDLIIIEDIEILPIILKYKKNAKILCDLREFYPLQHENNIKFNILERNYKYLLCKHFLSSCDAIITVSEGISNFFKNWFNLKSQVIMSCPYFIDIAPSKNISNTIKMVHHGAPNRDRKLERMIEIFQFLDERFYLDFYLVNYYNRKYIEHLKKIAEPFQKIRFLNPVSFNDIIPTMNKYDIGLYLLEPTGINTKHALPNKFFEYIQARLMIAI